MKRIRTKEFTSKLVDVYEDINHYLDINEGENGFRLIDIKYNQVIKDGDVYSYALVIIELDY